MVCCIVIKPTGKCQTLLLNRRKQALLCNHLESSLSYKPFVFNATKGLYVFVKKKESFPNIQNILVGFCDETNLKDIKMHDTSFRPKFFSRVTRQILISKETSVQGWKQFISSFLIQIDPFNPSSPSNNIVVFERFRNCISHNGSNHQKRYFKRKLKMLRERVSLEQIDNLLKFD